MKKKLWIISVLVLLVTAAHGQWRWPPDSWSNSSCTEDENDVDVAFFVDVGSLSGASDVQFDGPHGTESYYYVREDFIAGAIPQPGDLIVVSGRTFTVIVRAFDLDECQVRLALREVDNINLPAASDNCFLAQGASCFRF